MVDVYPVNIKQGYTLQQIIILGIHVVKQGYTMCWIIILSCHANDTTPYG